MSWIDCFKIGAFCSILIYAGIHDFLTHEVPDWIPFSILLIGLIRVQWNSSLLGLLCVPLPLLAAALLEPGGMGGGDIKCMGACGFYLGIVRGIAGLIMGLAFAVAMQMIQKRKKREPFALMPYLAAGCIISIL